MYRLHEGIRLTDPEPIIQPITLLSCPTCVKRMEVRQVEDWPHFPFCSSRCKLIDLGRWLGEDYRLPESDDPSSPSDDPAT
jgi:endogenous inhibitor of DNA gyrase (YacG/DUF329 family)